VAAVYIFKAALTAAENIGHRNRGDTQNQISEVFVTKAKSSPASATNNANRFRYRRKKSSNLGGYWIFYPIFFK